MSIYLIIQLLWESLMFTIIGRISATLAFLLSAYIMLGIFHVVPLVGYHVFGESLVRFLTQLAVIFFLIAAWAYWEI